MGEGARRRIWLRKGGWGKNKKIRATPQKNKAQNYVDKNMGRGYKGYK
jgi:hypothetical protein